VDRRKSPAGAGLFQWSENSAEVTEKEEDQDNRQWDADQPEKASA
jgi:hypothetical protein